MKSYFECHRERIIRNDRTFNEVAAAFKAKGYQVYATKSGYKTFVKIIGNGKQISIEFHEVPYGWRLYYDIPPSIERGSCVSIKDVHTSEFPYSINEIEALMQPLPHKDYDSKYEFYLKKL